MLSNLRMGIGLALGLAVVGNGLAAEKAGRVDQPVAPKLPTLVTVVYPFDALMKHKRGTVSVDFLVDRKGRLYKFTVLKSPGPEFTGAVQAYGEATDFSWSVKPKKGEEATAADKPFVLVHRDIEFDERKYLDAFHPETCPSKSAMNILRELRKGKGKFSTMKDLDQPLVLDRSWAPVFPLSLVHKVDKGSAMVEFYIDEKGHTVLPRVVSATDPAFGYAACLGVAMWRFKPPMRGGQPTVVKVRVPVQFSL